MSGGGGNSYEGLVSKADDLADRFLRNSKHYLPHLARLCLVSTFLEDGLRMWFQWTEQKDYINLTWRCGEFLGHAFVVINMLLQINGCLMILIRKYVTIAVGMLFGIILLQTVTYTVLWDFRFFMRNLALAGGLVLLLAEANTEVKTMFAGVPSMGGNQKQSYLQLAGRVLVIFMFLTLFSLELSVFRLVELLIGSVLVVCVGVGYKTKLSALVLVAWLTITNFLLNPFWLVPHNRIMRDFMKYDFFQTFSVIGGLLFVVALGPGGVSVDEHKKEW
ncbi:Surfeit locus protein 4 homolog [Geodia barretti]|uniref:Surfeit locus protein 4 homolog n=2 Tax=Geodia barretti TaxID=519541 RepID=A0AA35R1W7_GEOBA|nr:Surfeit locus protein 4 homolog [Geodia barretti]